MRVAAGDAAAKMEVAKKKGKAKKQEKARSAKKDKNDGPVLELVTSPLDST